MKIAILDDYQDQVRQLECFTALAPFEVTVFHHTETDEAILASTLAEFDALVLIRERTAITASLLAKLPNLKLISQTGKIQQSSGSSRVQSCQRCRGRRRRLADCSVRALLGTDHGSKPRDSQLRSAVAAR